MIHQTGKNNTARTWGLSLGAITTYNSSINGRRVRLPTVPFAQHPETEVGMGIAAPQRSASQVPGSMDEAERARQVRQAEELLFSGPSKESFAKALFRGEFHADALFPYPELPEAERATVNRAVAEVKAYADSSIDAVAIDRDAEIPQAVVDGLGRIGVLGMTA